MTLEDFGDIDNGNIQCIFELQILTHMDSTKKNHHKHQSGIES